MSKENRRRSLSVQLLLAVMLSLLAAAVAFCIFFALSNLILDKTVYGQAFTDRMEKRQLKQLQEYVNDERIDETNLHLLNVWCSRGDKVYLLLFHDGAAIYESTPSRTPQGITEDDSFFEDSAQEAILTLSDGTTVTARLYYYAGDAYYYWSIVISALIAFVVFFFSIIFFVRKKLRYIQRLKRELDILAGGDLNYRVTVLGEDELSELASGIDQMRRSIREHQEAEEAMRSANSQLVTAMSHDLRTPLTALLGYLELMERGKYKDEEQLRHFIGRSHEKALRIKEMADKLFEYFLVYSSEWEKPELEAVGADELIRNIWSEYAFSLESKGFTVHTDFGVLEGSLMVNIDLLRRAFDNLYSNLLKYADPAQPVDIVSKQDGGRAVLELKNHVSPQRDAKESTNIGLNTCRRILEYHGGAYACAEADGVYTVCLSLPLA
ncbi:MAG: HAMP domain-containing histidine kinase [Ruminococcaceae bacterium]|nr:HAMP domain-containing histidine kinase [Oscillospiraceae bacterium]